MVHREQFRFLCALLAVFPRRWYKCGSQRVPTGNTPLARARRLADIGVLNGIFCIFAVESREKMYGSFYWATSQIACVTALVLGFLLAGLQIRAQEGMRPYGRARWCLAGAYAAYGSLSLVEILLNDPSGLEAGGFAGCLVIVIGSLMAMFVTMTVLSFIRPEVITRKLEWKPWIPVFP